MVQSTHSKYTLFYKKAKLIAISITAFMYIAVASNSYYKWIKSRDNFGLDILSINNPIGAVNYIQQKGLQQKKGFADYLTSSYALWQMQPDYKTFIDLRDLDVFPDSFFNYYGNVISQPAVFYALDKQYNFDYVMLYRNGNEPLHYYLYNDSIYACVFVDPVAAVYQKTVSFSRGDIFATCTAVERSSFATIINTIFNPLYKGFNYEIMAYDLEAAKYYLTVGKLSLAEKRLNNYLSYDNNNTEAQVLKAKIDDLKIKMQNK